MARLLAAVALRGPAARAPSGDLGGARVAGGCGVAAVGGCGGASFGFGDGPEFCYETVTIRRGNYTSRKVHHFFASLLMGS